MNLASEAPRGLGLRQPSGAFAAHIHQAKAPEGWRSPRRWRGLVIAAITLSLYVNAIASTADFTSAFDPANKLYEQGKFSDAAAGYEKMIQSGSVSPAIYFNLGNAFFKSSQVGRALAAYRQAERLAPRDPDVRANLQFARNQIQGPTLPPNRWQRWLQTLTLNEWTALAAAALWLCLLLLALIQLRPKLKQPLRSFAIGSGVATIVLGVCLAATLRAQRRATLIVTTHNTTVRSGPLDESPALFIAHDGAEFAILDTKNDWLQVSAGQRVGWLKREHAQLFPEGFTR